MNLPKYLVSSLLLAFILSSLLLAAGEPSKAIPFDQLGAAAEQQSPDNGTGITPTATGAKLRAVMQDLEAEATPDGLWLTSTADEDAGKPNRFRIRATSVGRDGEISAYFDERGTVRTASEIAVFLRPGLTEEYSVSTGGVRQDFLVHERPAGSGELNVELQITGAKAEEADFGAKLTVEGSGRELAYSRLKVTDATGRELAARMVVNAADRVQVIVNDIASVYPVRVDPTFSDLDWISMGQSPGTNSTVHALALDLTGNLYVGGDFASAGGVANTSYLAKWNGNTWSAVGNGVNSSVYAIAVSGTDVYVGGYLTSAGAVAANYIARWNGSVWSALGTGTNDAVRAITISGTDVYVGGDFTLAGGVTNTSRVARWSGGTWSALGSGTNSTVFAIAVSGTDVYVGGGFSLAGGVVNTARIAKWSGGVWSALGTGANSNVLTLAVSGADVYAGGDFSLAGGVSNTRSIARWNGTWNALGTGTDFSVRSLHIVGADVYAGGNFSSAGGVAGTSRIARWNGSSWNSLGTGVNSSVNAIAVVGSNVYAGGSFSSAGGSEGLRYIAKWSAGAWGAVGNGMDGAVYALASTGNDLYAGGDFRVAGGIVVKRIAKWNGSTWSSLGTGIGDIGGVRAIAILGSDVYAGGTFPSAGGASNTTFVAKWNGSSWSGLSTGTEATVNALAVSGSDLYVGGDFNSAGGLSNTSYIAKWNGSSWSSMGTGMPNYVYCLATSGTDVFAGGAFVSAGGTAANYIARWNGSAWNALGTGTNGSVRGMAVSGSDLYVGGTFSLAGGVSNTSSIAKWNGSAWTAMGTGVNSSVTSVVANSTNVFVAGEFTSAGLGAANRIAMWNGRTWQPLGSGLNNTVSALSLTGNNLFAGGGFTTGPANNSPFIVQANVASINRFPLVLTNSGSGSVTANPPDADYAPGTPVTLTAVPSSGFALTGWSGDVATSGNPITVTMDRYRAITANFGPSLPLATALDGADIIYTSGGAASWYGQAPITHDGIDAARSGAITHNQESWFETTVTGPGLLSFWWRASSEANYDFLEFYIDGALQNGRISGESGWQLKTYTVFTGNHTLRWRYAKDKSGSTGTDSGFVDEINWSPDGLAMPLVLDQYGIPFSRGGTTPWFGESTISHDGVDAAQSGSIDNNQQTWLQALAVGPGTLSFWWKVSSEVNYDFLEFYINDVLQTGRISGEVDWQQKSYSVLDGSHTFRWIYSKDRDTSAGLDTAWLDQVVWATSVQSSFAAWSTNYFSAVELAELLVSGPNANADGDSLVNLLEFALGGNPKQGNSAPLPVLTINAESKPQLTFSCDTSRIGITYRVQYSTDFATWNDIATSVNGGRTLPVGVLSTVSDTATGIRNVIVTYQNSTTTQPTVFLRLTVNQP